MGNRLIALRQGQILSRKELAKSVRVSEVTITRYENGNRQPSAEIIPRYAKALNCTADELLAALPVRKGA